MSAICTCLDPKPYSPKGCAPNAQACRKCGFWYDQAHGSQPIRSRSTTLLSRIVEDIQDTAAGADDDQEPAEVPDEVWLSTKRNEPCPCGSGHAFKHCCKIRLAKVRIGQKSLRQQARLAFRSNEIEEVALHFEVQLAPLLEIRVREMMGGLFADMKHVEHRLTKQVFPDHSREWSWDGKPFIRLQAPSPTSGDTFRVVNVLEPGLPGG